MESKARALLLSMFASIGLNPGCATPPSPSENAAAATASPAEPILTFNSDGSITQSGPLLPGQSTVVRYWLSRLPHCRQTYAGQPAWVITGWYSVDGGPATNEPIAPLSATLDPTRPFNDISFRVPDGKDLAFWFVNGDRAGCLEWDSNGGRNHHFVIGPTTPADAPVLSFNADGSVTLSAPLVAGRTAVLRYANERLLRCRQTYQGAPAWSTSAYYSTDGGAPLSFSVTNTDPNQTTTEVSFQVPFGKDLGIWFLNADRSGCKDYDSREGRNHHFAIESASSKE
jgi:hypothetical protein